MTFRSVDQALAALPGQLETAVLRKLQAAADELEGVLVATGAYNDDTGANRAATFAAAAAGRQVGTANQKARAALAEAARLNPGQEAAEELELPAGVVRVVGSTMTAYARDLEEARAGQNAYLEDTMRLEAPRLRDAAVAGVREVIR